MSGERGDRLGTVTVTAGVIGLFLAMCHPVRGAPTTTETPLETGYHAMYDLRFDQARQVFTAWERSHPVDPVGPASEAASYLFSEFNRMGILRAEFFVNERQFKKREFPLPDPVAARAFSDAVSSSLTLAQSALARNPRDANALFAEVLDLGLRADYAALVEGRDLAALRNMKSAGSLANRLLQLDPGCYDAYLATGVESYLLSLYPSPMRWALRLYGAETSRAHGVRELELTAERGRYLLPFARLLLAIAALRDHNRTRAVALLDGLAREFPDNPLYAAQAARLR